MLARRVLTGAVLLLLAVRTAFAEEARTQDPAPEGARPDAPGAARSPEDAAKLRRAAKELVGALGGLGPGEVWTIARELGRLGDEVAPVLASELEGAPEPKKLALGRAMCLAGKLGLGRRVLLELAHKGATREVRVYAARAVGMSSEPLGLGPVAEALGLILDAEGDPLVKCALADAMLRLSRGWSVGTRTGGQEDGSLGLGRARALSALKEILDGADDAAAGEAALALGEGGYGFLARSRLNEMAAEPTDQGRRARLVLHGVRPGWVRMLSETARLIQERYVDPEKVDRESLFAAAAKGMARSLDDFSDYLTEDDVKSMDEMLSNSYEGIGALVGMRDGYFTIISPFYSGPAYRAGLRSMDRITEVAGCPAGDLGFAKTIKKLKGPKGTPVKLKVARRGWSEPQGFTIVRDTITIESCHARLLPGGVGYVRLVRFSEDAGRDVRKAVAELVKGGLRGLVFDLRDNGGGLLSEAVEVADVFLVPGRVVVYSKGREEVVPLDSRSSDRPDELGGLPLVVLVNTGSASASEIVAGSLQDWARARIVGSRTFGKGSVQSLIPLRATGMKTKLRLTMARYHLPWGRPIDKKHPVVPDVEVKGDVLAGWESEEIIRLRLHEKIDEHIRKAYQSDPGPFGALAESDGGRLEVYPGLRELVRGFDTRVSDAALRLIAHASTRRLVADGRGKQFIVDLQEDRVLRRGVYEILSRTDDPGDAPEAARRILDEFRPPARPKTGAALPAEAPAPRARDADAVPAR